MMHRMFAMLSAIMLLAFFAGVAGLSQEAYGLKTAFEGSIYSGQTFVAEGKTFTVTSDELRREVLARAEGNSLFILNNSCQQQGAIRICIDNIEYDYKAGVDQIKVRAISLAPSITISRTLDSSVIEAGAGATVSVTITNQGGLASNVTYTDTFPKGVTVKSTEGIRVLGDNTGVIWESRSLKTESVSFSYVLSITEPIEQSLVATLTYFDGQKIKSVKSSAIEIKATPRLIHSLKVGAKNSLIGQPNNVTLSLTNKEAGSTRATVEVVTEQSVQMTQFPKEFKRISDTLLRGELDLRKSSGNVTFNKTEEYVFEFKGIRVGESPVVVSVNYSTNEVNNRHLPQLKEKIAFTQKGIKIRTNGEDAEAESNQARTFILWVQNLNPYVVLKEVLVQTDGGGLLDLPDSYQKTVGKGEQTKIIEQDFYPPLVETAKGYTIKANISYLTEFGDNFTESTTITYTVNPIAELLITQSIAEQVIESGKETTVTIKVKNPRKTRISNVFVSENISGFEIIGRTTANLVLKAGDEVTAYTYIIKGPRVQQETDYFINTTVTYNDANAAERYANSSQYEVAKSSKITVKPAKFELTATRTLDISEVNAGDVIDVTYQVANPSSEYHASEITLFVSQQPDIDVVGTAALFPVSSLEAGEEVVLSGKEKRRAKSVGSLVLGKAKLRYKNQFGEWFEVNVSETSLTVKENAHSTADFLYVTKNVTASVINNTGTAKIAISATSKGRSLLAITIEDGKFTKEVALKNGSTATVTYTKKFPVAGTYQLEPAKVIYETREMKLLAFSNVAQLGVLDNPLVILEKKVVSPIKAGEKAQVNVSARLLDAEVSNLTLLDDPTASAKERQPITSAEESARGVVQWTYHLFVKESGQLPPSRLTYTYDGELYEVESNGVYLDIINESMPVDEQSAQGKTDSSDDSINATGENEKVIKADKEGNDTVTARIARLLLSLLTWQR